MKYIIIGAVAGGASAAARLRRLDEQAEIIVFEKGEYISYASCGLPYYIGDVIRERNDLLVQTAASFSSRFRIDVRVRNEVLLINPSQKKVLAFDHVSGKKYEETYDKLVLSPGAEPLRPPLPGIDSPGIFTLRSVNDTDLVKNYVKQRAVRNAVIIGAGFIGLEMAENLHGLGIQVTVVEMGAQVLAPADFPVAAMAQQELRDKGVYLMLNSSVSGFGHANGQTQVQFANGESIPADLVLLSVGVRPDTRLVREAGLKLGPAKGIYVNEYLQTSDPDIYAVGDAIEFENPVTGQSMNTYLAGPANKQGRICANNIVLGNVEKYKGSINTAIVKIFDLTVAVAGTAVKHLKKAGIPHIASVTHGGSHAGYYPGARQMTIQLAFAPDTGRLLGAQVAGYEGVDKRIDVLSLLIQRQGTVDELAEFEHAYAPPYSSAKDPLNMAGFVASNILEDRLHLFYWDEIGEIGPGDLLVDVRTAEEHRNGSIPGALNIPLDELRDRLQELDRSKRIYIYCQAGLRGYLASRILEQNRFGAVRNLSGGYRLWESCARELQQPEPLVRD